MKIKAIRNVSENYQISLSVDGTENVNFVMGEAGTGKTTLFNKIRSCLSDPKTNTGVELEPTEKGDYETDHTFGICPRRA